jgi:hypothetical protein
MSIYNHDIGRCEARKHAAHSGEIIPTTGAASRICWIVSPAINNLVECVLVQSRSAGSARSARACAVGSVAGACHRERRHLGRGTGWRANWGRIYTKIVKTKCDRIGNGCDTGAQLNRLSCGIPSIKSKKKVYAPKNKDDQDYHNGRRFNQYGPILVGQQASQQRHGHSFRGEKICQRSAPDVRR